MTLNPQLSDGSAGQAYPDSDGISFRVQGTKAAQVKKEGSPDRNRKMVVLGKLGSSLSVSKKKKTNQSPKKRASVEMATQEANETPSPMKTGMGATMRLDVNDTQDSISGNSAEGHYNNERQESPSGATLHHD